jgi:hypothetical protein
MMTDKYPYCQVSGCHRRAARAVEIDLPASWEASRKYTTLTVVAGLCLQHGHDVSARVQAMLQARTEFHDLLTIIEMATRFELAQRLRLDAATDEANRLEIENGGLRQDLAHVQAELRLARREPKRLVAAGAS